MKQLEHLFNCPLPKNHFSLIVFFLLLFSVTITTAQIAPTDFVTTWKTDNPGTSNNTSITIPAVGAGHNYDVDWDNDGVFEDFGVNGSITHDYGIAGTYTVRIRGDFPYFRFNNTGDKDKILSIDQWGNIQWLAFSLTFRGATNLTYNATDVPDLSNVGSLSSMFQGASSFNGDIGDWDVSNVTSMARMFTQTSFNRDIGDWDVSNVTSMFAMFENSSFNQDISNWDVSNVTRMVGMFAQTPFNQDIGGWDVSKVTEMNQMFSLNNAFNQDIGDWDVSQVTDMRQMFFFATAFNQDISNWDVSQVTNMNRMFGFASTFNQDIGNWVVSNVTNMERMFEDASAFNQDIGNWDVSNVTTMNTMFKGASAFNQDISNWDVSKVTNMGFMFRNADAFQQDLNGWDVSNVTNMESMFQNNEGFNGDIGNWNTMNVTNMSEMFSFGSAFNRDIGNWNTMSVTNMSEMFRANPAFNQDISNWNTQNVTNMNGMFQVCNSFNQNLGNWDISKVTDMGSMFFQNGMNVASYDNTLIGWAAQSVQPNVTLGANGQSYCNGIAARNILTSSPNNWNILGDSPLLTNVSVNSTDESCAGANDGTITAFAQTNQGQVRYSIDGGATFIVPGQFTGLGAGTYTVILKVFGNPEACEIMEMVTINTTPVTTWYKDTDNDDHSDGTTLMECVQPAGYKAAGDLISLDGDCDDGDNMVFPGATEICNNKDDNCDGIIDNLLTIDDIIVEPETCSGFMDGSINILATSNSGPLVYSIDGGANFSANNTFNNLAPGTYNIVVKVQGEPALCDLTDVAVVDQGGSGQSTIWYEDQDSDGYSSGVTQTGCVQPPGYVSESELQSTGLTDCNDNDPNEFPGQIYYRDVDDDNWSDGFFTSACLRPTGFKSAGELNGTSGDCNDNDASINPNATEICNGIDENCNGQIDEGAPNETYTGSVFFTSQTQLDAWAACYDVIDGNVTILGGNINNLSALSNLTQITGAFNIMYNIQLHSLNGLESLTSVGGNFMMMGNFFLTDCCAILNLVNGGISGATIIASNGNGCQSVADINNACINPLIGSSAQLGTQDNALGQTMGMSLFPNPVTDQLNIKLNGFSDGGKLFVFDLFGRIVHQQQVTNSMDMIQLDIRANGWSKGKYFVKLVTSNKSLTERFIVAH